MMGPDPTGGVYQMITFVIGFVAGLILMNPRGSQRKGWGSTGQPWKTKKRRTRKLI
jgi:hypothetical protein